jgi:hypothetical protein
VECAIRLWDSYFEDLNIGIIIGLESLSDISVDNGIIGGPQRPVSPDWQNCAWQGGLLAIQTQAEYEYTALPLSSGPANVPLAIPNPSVTPRTESYFYSASRVAFPVYRYLSLAYGKSASLDSPPIIDTYDNMRTKVAFIFTRAPAGGLKQT